METNSQRFKKPGPRVEWAVDKEFADKASGLVVRVSKLNLGNRAKFDLALGQNVPDRGFVRGLRPQVRSENAKITVTHLGMTAARLLDEAYEYIETELQLAEDRFIERKQEFELRSIERTKGTVSVPSTGKTAREAGKRKQHEQNLITRRALDQERTSASKSGRTVR